VARVVNQDEKEYALIQKAIRKKYGVQDLLLGFLVKVLKKYGDGCAVLTSSEKKAHS
tara:strand:- start:446 stop:616 length:171 start_codon:yes stop_codon:yes gene_type:complete